MTSLNGAARRQMTTNLAPYFAATRPTLPLARALNVTISVRTMVLSVV